MTTEFVSVPADFTTEETLRRDRAVERTRETIYAIYIVHQATAFSCEPAACANSVGCH